jgi:hypothetical protein
MVVHWRVSARLSVRVELNWTIEGGISGLSQDWYLEAGSHLELEIIRSRVGGLRRGAGDTILISPWVSVRVGRGYYAVKHALDPIQKGGFPQGASRPRVTT